MKFFDVPLRILLGVIAWFLAAGLLAMFVFPAGIYSCGDIATFQDPPLNESAVPTFVENCQEKQSVGMWIAMLHFGLAVFAGLLLNQLAFAASGLEAAFPGAPLLAFFVGFLPVLGLQIVFVAKLISLFVRRPVRAGKES